MQLVLDTNGLVVKKRKESFWISAKEGRRYISPHRVSSIAVIADCLLSAAAIRLAAKHGIPIYFFDGAGRAEVKTSSPFMKKLAVIRKEQLMFSETVEGTQWVIDLFTLKLSQQIACLTFLEGKEEPKQVC